MNRMVTRRQLGADQLIDFVLARLDEEEHDATWSPSQEWDAATVATWAGKPVGNLAIRHAGRWSPERVRADVTAKRAIVAEYERLDALEKDNNVARAASVLSMEWVVWTLATAWADHPDFRSEWRP